MYRHGTQTDGVAGFGPSFGFGPTQVPRPVDDTTQNYGVLAGEYAGTSPWGQRFNFKLAYKGSNYDDFINGYTIQDPFTNGVYATGYTADHLAEQSLRTSSAERWAPTCLETAATPARSTTP